MQIFISPFGMIIIAIFYLIATIPMIFLWKKIRRFRYRWLLFISLILLIIVLPVSDELWISYNFYEVCKDSGVHVKRKIEVEGYYNETGGGIDTPGVVKGFKETDFSFVERLIGYNPEAKPLKVSHVEKVNGEWFVTILDHPSARYHYRYEDSRVWVPIGFQLYKNEMQIIDSETGEIVSRETSFSRYPSLVEGVWIRFFGSGQKICSRPLDDKEKKTLTGSLTYHTFIPVKKQ